MEWKCKNCGKLLEDSLLTHCSVGCRFESYLKSQSVNPLPSQKIISKILIPKGTHFGQGSN